jgi:NitT/TauT family transport system permease protein
MRFGKRRKLLWQSLGLGAFLLLWQVGAWALHSNLILPSPLQTASKLFQLTGEARFWNAVAGTLGRVILAFALSMLSGSLTGLLSSRWPGFDAFLSPILTIIRATPVLALILLAMFWFSSSFVPVFSAILMAYPIVHTSMYSGAKTVDKDLLEMATLFRVPTRTRFFKLRVPSASLHILAGAKNALGLTWKVVVAGEVLSQPLRALGTGMQEARLSIETTEVFAWAIVSIILCGLSEYILGTFVRRAPGNGRSDT